MKGEYAVNAQKLMELADSYSKNNKTANRLSEYVRRAKYLDNPAKHDQYNKIITHVDKLANFYFKMKNAATETSTDVVALIRKVEHDSAEMIYSNNKLLK